MSDTPIADSDPEDDKIVGAVQAAQENAQEALAALPPPQQQGPPAAAPDATRPVLGPLGTAPYGAQAPCVAPAAPARQRVERERSPRRDAELPATPESDDETPQITGAQSAALRGDHVGTLDSLPDFEETPQPPASNARGGAPRT